MISAQELDLNKEHCTLEFGFITDMKKLQSSMSNYKAPKNRHSQSDILIHAWEKLYQQKKEKEVQVVIADDIEKAKYIRKLVCKFGGFEETDPHFIVGRKNGNSQKGYKRYTDCRHVGMYLTKQHTKLIMQSIASIFYVKNHSTPYNAIDKVENFIYTKEEFVTEMISFVETKLRQARYINEED